MRLEIVLFAEFSALGRFELLHGAPIPPRLLGGERLNRVNEAVAVVALDLLLGQPLALRRHPTRSVNPVTERGEDSDTRMKPASGVTEPRIGLRWATVQ